MSSFNLFEMFGIPEEEPAKQKNTKSKGAEKKDKDKSKKNDSVVVHEPMVLSDEIEIFDEEGQLASAPETGDVSGLWMTISGISAGFMAMINRKRKAK